MEPRKESTDIKTVVEQVKASFSSVYLTLTSIIQACVLGYLIFLVGSDQATLNPTSTATVRIVSTFLMIITTWNEYMMGATAFRWIPRLKDTFIPFVLGVSEFLVVQNIFSSVSLWCYSLGLFCFLGYLAFLNMFHSAREHAENSIIFGLLGHLPRVTEVWAFSSAITFSLFGVLSGKFASRLSVQYVPVLCSVALFAGFLYRGVLYWNRIVGKARAKHRPYE